MKHMYFKTCPYCGAHLDPGEICDCTHQDKLKNEGGNSHEGHANRA